MGRENSSESELAVKDIIINLNRKFMEVIENKYSISLIKDNLYLEFPTDTIFGDITSNISFNLAKELKKSPPTIADEIQKELKKWCGQMEFKYVENITATKGYINFHLKKDFHIDLVNEIYKKGKDYGSRDIGQARKVQVEFVSANPTGPLTVAAGRQAAVGDVIARLMKFCGYNVTREYYLNDTGNQIHLLGKSIYSRYSEVLGKSYPFPEEGYHGEYIKDIAKEIFNRDGEKFIKLDEEEAISQFAKFGVETIMGWIKKDLADFGVIFDVYFSQDEFEKSGKVKSIILELKNKNLVYEKDSALWIKTSEFGDQEDRVLLKSDGGYTYRTTDIAYHKDKFERGFERVINLWGPDHHAHTSCMESALKMLGYDKPDSFKVLIVQHCRLLEGGKEVKMSKRAATYVTLRELIDEVGVDVARYFFVMRDINSHLDFDLDMAKKQSLENPIYYVQYAHARISSIFRKGVESGLIDESEIKDSIFIGNANLEYIGQEEQKLMQILLRFPDTLEKALCDLDTQHLTNYVYTLSGVFQSYYQKGDKDRNLRVLCENETTRKMRLKVINAVKIVLRNLLKLLGVSAPEKMEKIE